MTRYEVWVLAWDMQDHPEQHTIKRTFTNKYDALDFFHLLKRTLEEGKVFENKPIYGYCAKFMRTWFENEGGMIEILGLFEISEKRLL